MIHEVANEIAEAFENAWFWLTGAHCLFCGAWSSGYWHRSCPEVAKRDNAEAVRIITSKVRDILKDDPADRSIHAAHEALDDLDKAFPSEAKENSNG